MKRVLKIALTILLLGVVSFSLLSCGSESGETELPENQVVTVQRGNLTIDITAVGNLALSRTEDLAFEIAGTVEEVLVEEGDTVEEGQMLAKLDTLEWEEQLTALERTLTTAKRQLTAKERAVTTAERNLAAKERAVIAKELALLQAQVNLQTAENNLSEIAEVKKVQDVIDDTEYDLKFAQEMWEQAIKLESPGVELYYWRDQIILAKAELAEAQQELREVLAGSSVRVTTDVAIAVAMQKLQIELAQLDVEDAKIAIDDAKIAIDDAKIAIDDARMDVEDARVNIEDARKALDEAMDASPEVKAPFAGFVTKVNVEGGDEVLKGTVAVVVADPTKFEADILVSEMDILQVKLGGEASVQVDAMQGMSLPAKVTHISPTATIQQGVVNYKVKVEVQSLEAVAQERQAAQQEAMQKMEEGELPEQIKQAIEEGRITQEQAEEMIRQRQQGQVVQQGQMPTMLPENFQLREGLTVTVSIIVDEATDVLLVPNSAITTQGRQTFVQVLAADGTFEQRAIQPGISDYQFTEVTEGLSEGEKVVVPQGTTTTPTTPQQQPPGGFIPGMGRMR